MWLLQHAMNNRTRETRVRDLKSSLGIAFGTGLLLATMAVSAFAQGATGGMAGTVKDAQGGVIPGATVTLISETRGTHLTPVVTNAGGDFRFPNLPPDTYTIQVEMPSFKMLKQTGVHVSPGPALVVGTMTIELGGKTEEVTVRGESPLIQAQSGERSFTVTSRQMAELPINGRDYATLLQLTPGVQVSTGLGSLQVIGGSGGTNYMMDGLTNMDPGVNREAQKVSIDAIQEVKVLTSSYQAEYGRSSGLQVNAVTKSGTNHFRGTFYDVEQNSKWNSNNKVNILNGDAKPVSNQRDWGWSIGGPVGKAGGSNKIFFFWNQEYNPRTRGGTLVTFRMPTALERAGDFSKTLDNQGNPYPYIRDPRIVGGTCTAANTSGCFQDGGVVGRIPKDQLYSTGLAILNWWPLPNMPDTPGVAYNYQRTQDDLSLYGYQPIIKLDFQPLQNLRGSFKFAEYQQPANTIRGSIPGFNDTKEDNFGIWTTSYVANWTMTPSTFVEASFGRNTHHQEGCSITGGAPNFCFGALAANPTDNRYNVGMGDLPLLFPDAGVMDTRYKAFTILNSVAPPLWDGTRATPVPSWAWGTRVANAPPNIGWPGFILDTVANTFNVSVTKIHSAHTYKAGYAFIESVQRRGNANIQGTYTFSNDANNPLDTSFGFANAAVGVFSSIGQTSRWSEGAYTALNNEWYIQDNWKVNRNLTLDYGMRFIAQQAGYDALLHGNNFLPSTWNKSVAPAVYVYGCANNVYPCSGANRLAMNPLNGQFIGTSGQASVIVGTLVPGSGDPLNGLKRPGQDIASTFYKWPKLVLGPRWGAAWDLSGNQKFVVRGGGGMFFDRPSDSNIYTTVNNPPSAQSITVRYGKLQDLSKAGLSTTSPPQIQAFEYIDPHSPMPTSVQWNVGVQMVLPLAAALDVSYTGQHAYNKETTQNINNIDLGAAFNPALQDPTLAVNGVTNSLVNTNVAQARFYQGYGPITMVQYRGWETYHSLQIALTRRFKDGVQFGFNDTVGLSDVANVTQRLQHNADGTVTVRADQAQAQELLGDQNPTRHSMKAYFTWALPRLQSTSPTMKAVGLVINDWQLSGIWTGITATPYTVGFSYSSGGGNLNLTGSPDYAGRIKVVGDPGAGCSSDLYRQFNTNAFQGPPVGSVGLDSGNGYLRGCFQSSLDMSVARNIHLGGGRSVQLRVDAFNALNQAGITGRQNTMNLNSPADPVTITNLPYDAAGNLIPTLSKPRGAGFGLATAFQTARAIQFQARFLF